ncbi:hypothetical protein M569_00381 [Genlisea aurea]|uniref:POX domain-containing protein n=1 Tax=Genlisea aurea TaxID=192259 RepID=S8D3U0_9LAMI|nr:hypothetical protein M569_00381 [Genlisea aurea]
MGTYYHGDSEIQGGGDGLQTLILMNPAFVGYGDGQQAPPSGAVAQGNNFVFLNSGSAAAGVGNNLSHGAPPQTQHFVGIPLHRPPPSSPQQQQDVSALHGFMAQRATTYGLYNLPMDMSAAARDVTRSQGGLSLSLSSHQQHPQSLGGGYGPPFGSAAERDVAPISGGSPSSASAVSNGVTGGVQSVLLSSKYLKAAQELLDEVVNVGKGARTPAGESSSKATTTNSHNKTAAESSVSGAAANEPDNVGSSSKLATDLTTAERQEVQMKKAKLVNMLDEVEQRYRQYHHQMQIVVAWFEQAAGIGSAKTYTALALQTISKQFRCLKDAILEQIRSVSKTLGEDENLEGKIEGSRLKYVDNQIRQQRALQQLGMIQNNAWRPQRGLPERSVSVLRAWLFEHFLHP